MTDFVPFERLALIGIGLIGSSLARVTRQKGLAKEIAIATRRRETLERAQELNLGDHYTTDPAEAVAGADLVIVCVPVGACGPVAQQIGPHLAQGAIVSDVGSVKRAVIDAMQPHLPAHCHFVPGHPIAGTEYSGPDSGFATLFQDRWCLLTPSKDTDPTATERLSAYWRACGSPVEVMDADHHDMVLAVVSHLPHLIAYNIVGTAEHLEQVTQSEVIKFSASGFRDFTRIAASDPVMWRDVFLNNRDAVLEMLGRFSEDLSTLQRAIRWGDGDTLLDTFSRTRDIRRTIIEAGQETPLPNFGRDEMPDGG